MAKITNLQGHQDGRLSLRLGLVDTVVTQLAKAATELFKNHDARFCDRMVPYVLTSHNYCEGSLAIGRFGPYWRMLRRVCAAELLANKRINETVHIRHKCIDQRIWSIEDNLTAANKGESGKVKVAHYLFLMSFNLIGNLSLSKDLLDSKCKEGYEFFEALDKISVWAGKPNTADFLPFLKWPDPQGLRRNMSRDMGRAKDIVAGFVKERMEEYELGKEKANEDFLDVLLEYEGDGKEWNGKIPYKSIIIIILGQNFDLIPFGSGRRICVGMALAQRVVPFGLPSLVHNFEWDLDKDFTPKTLDMSERIGISLRKLESLNLICKKPPMKSN
ncbi:hypothetical protein JCGZ_27052 [Jatropha curcas]|uniref:Cytochrome P450 n=1 Tax=Jatropha curcas TaxID=180498 RepID=A0A067L786_JATCU|nr:hypothetical protein JCGZ_27052 [Jatropha curcas]